jgi:phosphoribosyl 1,2-cyclic phosphodiesterase
MKFSVLASGSKGNSTFIATKHHNILVDLGTTSGYVERQLKELGVSPSDIDIIILTHTHSDHINGLKIFLKKYHPTLFLSSKMYKELSKILSIPSYYLIDENTLLDTLSIKIFKTSHDANDSNGYVFEEDGKSLAYITDTGFINNKNYLLLHNHTYYCMEFNHDVEKLMNGKYPYYLKQRILSDKGHLSNKDASRYLCMFVGPDTKGVVLIHLSEENNSPDLALSTLENTLISKEVIIKKIIVSSQKERTELIKL